MVNLMKVMWVCNVPSNELCEELNISRPSSGSWLNGMISALKSNSHIELVYVFGSKLKIDKYIDNVHYLTFSRNGSHKFNLNLFLEFEDIINKTHPDVIHIWGTEYPHTYSCIQAAQNLNVIDNVVIYIQGMVQYCASHVFVGLEPNEIKGWTFRDIIRRDNIVDEKKMFSYRGKYEKFAIENAINVIGRTTWDFACTKEMNPGINYFYCGESLREPFYENAGKWCFENCEKYSIFITQGRNPIKGFHMFLDGFAEIVKTYPDAKVYLTGTNPFETPVYRISNYQKIIKKKIAKYKLKDNIIFLGRLDGEQMCERMLKSNVFVSPSTIENSPNSICEAMMLGTPVVASFVGGTMDLLKDKVDGYLYQADASYMMSYYVKEVFNDPEKAYKMGQKASAHALKTNDKEENLKALLSIYEQLVR